MSRIKSIIFILFCLLLVNCESGNDKFPLDKRYWDAMDYANATRELKYGYEADEKLPSFNDPETRAIVEKYTDHQNFNVVLEDSELGLKHRNSVAETFFARWKDMATVYRATDRQDKYLYEREMLAVEHFGLDLQLKYFKLGNDDVLNRADDPNSKRAQNVIKSNVRTLIENYNLYLDELDYESGFSDEGLALLAEGIDTYFPKLLETYPDANYNSMQRKAELLSKKSKSTRVKTSLEKLIEKISSKKNSTEVKNVFPN